MVKTKKRKIIVRTIKSAINGVNSLPFIITAKDIGKLLNVSDETARNIFKSGLFPVCKLGGRYITTAPRIFKWLGIAEEYELPCQQKVLITVGEVGDILRICEMQAYKIMNREDFPSLYIGARIMTQVPRFYEWIENQFEEVKK